MTAHTPADDAGDVAALRAEVERLRAWKAEALPVMAGLQEVGNALGVPLGRQITARATVDTALDLRNQRDEARAEADSLRVTLGKVAALESKSYVVGSGSQGEDPAVVIRVADLRDALAADPVSLADVRAETPTEGVAKAIKEFDLDRWINHADLRRLVERLVARTEAVSDRG